VRKQKEPSADCRARERRSTIFQRALFLAFRTTISSSHQGVLHKQGGNTCVEFPRVLLYLADQPEDKSVLCLKGGYTPFPCSSCMVKVDEAGAHEALTAADRDALLTVEHQLESAGHRRYQREVLRRADLEAADSAHCRVPVLAVMAGLSTAPYQLYKTIGFDALHVRAIIFIACAFPTITRRKVCSGPHCTSLL